MSVHWPSVTNLANSNIGVGILALPTCVKSMGFLLGSVVLLVTGYITVQISNLLIYAAHHSKSRSYEQLSMKTYGNSGKRLCELCICAMNYGMLVSFHCVIGDSSDMLAQILGAENTPHWRLAVQLFVVLSMALPFSLLRNLSSLNILSVVALVIYSSFTVFIFSHGVGEWLIQTSVSDVPWVDMSGLLKSFPIIFLAFNCQTSLLPIYNELPNPSMKKMTRVASYAIIFVGLLYFIIGNCGVLSFGSQTDGNVLNNFPVSSLIVVFKMGFVLCIAFSFPLVIYPMRISVNSLFLADKGDPNHMNVRVFRTITVVIIFTSLILSTIFPEVDMVLALSGASAGSFIGMIFPALIFLKISDRGESGRGFAKLVLFIGLVTTTLGVSNILFGGVSDLSSGGKINPKHFDAVGDALEPRVQLGNDNNEFPDAKTLGNAEIITMLEKLQSELDETKRELRAEKVLRIENQIKELKEQLKAQNVNVEAEVENKKEDDELVGVVADKVVPAQQAEENHPQPHQPADQQIVQPVGEQQKLVAEQQKPVVEQQKPVAEQQKPGAEQQKPVAELQKPVAEQQKPVAEQQQLVAEQQKPVAEQQQHVVEQPQVAEQQQQIAEQKVNVEEKAPEPLQPPAVHDQVEKRDLVNAQDIPQNQEDNVNVEHEKQQAPPAQVLDEDPVIAVPHPAVAEADAEKTVVEEAGIDAVQDEGNKGEENKGQPVQDPQNVQDESVDEKDAIVKGDTNSLVDENQKQEVPQEKLEEKQLELDPEQVNEKLKQLEKLEQEKVELMAEVLKDENKVDNMPIDKEHNNEPNNESDKLSDKEDNLKADNVQIDDKVVAEAANESQNIGQINGGEM